MIVGASAGSTGGGLKVLRIRVAFELAKREVLRIIQPKKVIAISPHSHDGKQKCRMQEKGSVLINVPVSMAVSDLNEFSCTEPENTELYSYIKRLYI